MIICSYHKALYSRLCVNWIAISYSYNKRFWSASHVRIRCSTGYLELTTRLRRNTNKCSILVELSHEIRATIERSDDLAIWDWVVTICCITLAQIEFICYSSWNIYIWEISLPGWNSILYPNIKQESPHITRWVTSVVIFILPESSKNRQSPSCRHQLIWSWYKWQPISEC